MNTDFLAHLGIGTTTLCRAWGVTRSDGLWYGFTDHDMDIGFDGMMFKASSGLAAKALQQTTGLAVDNSEAVGALSDAAIDEGDVLAGRFDGAEVQSWLVNWADTSQRNLQFRGNFGEITRSGGAFKVELRGLTDRLNIPQGRVYQRGCSAVLGDVACKFAVATPGFSADLVVGAVGAQGALTLLGTAAQVEGWFEFGRARVVTGAATGLVGMVKRDRLAAGGRAIDLWQSFAAPLVIGDQVVLEAGCDRTAKTCRVKFSNLLNFQGFPHIPGEDWQISYPNGNQPKDGGSLFA